ncbi:ExeM/NucH family extracellular endonuclease [Thalassotalea sediminis]|uniref:ExeM/NucH family extracellular endonuclease n=1 Tax=Thalassotalea sediminis TaxID=1759089 RepID=UPI002573F3A3|nr:ExeM/NucH family extracellular endonuclease [Thalassotalea sediminis]
MNKINLIALSTLLSTTASADILISEYIEGSSYNKAIELFNTSESNVDLTNYQIEIYFNGKSVVGRTIDLSGSVAAKNTFVVAHTDIDLSATTDLKTGNLLFNGDDAIVLKKNGIIIDSIGKVGQDPGSQWGTSLTSTKDNTLIRNATISTGDINPFDDFNPADQWQGYDNNTLENLGEHTFNGSTNGGDDGGNTDGGGDNQDNTRCNDTFTSIASIQGNSNNTPLAGQVVWTEGVVTHTLQQTGYKGFFLQSADNEIDNNDATSEGVFVYHQSTQVNPGDRIRIKAKVSEYNNLTQLSNIDALTICQSNVNLPVAQTITLPLTTAQRESLEGMRVSLSQAIVTDTYNYGRYGQFEVAPERLFTPTQIASPGEAANQLANQNANMSIVIDDGETVQNPEYLPAPAPELTTINSLRSGDTVTLIDGILSYHFGDYQILSTVPLNTQPTNARQAMPNIETLGNLRVASFNVLNYFNGDGEGGGFPTARGAKNELEFERQRQKVIAAIAALDADIVGLMEIENDGYNEKAAIADLTQGLNDYLNNPEYQFIIPKRSEMGNDAIAVGILYKVATVSPSAPAKVLNSANSALDKQGNVLFLDTKNRPMLTQLFSHKSSNSEIVVAVNHLKSKGSNCDSLGDFDKNDGQGNCNLTRTRAASAVSQFLNQEYTDKAILVIGDLNAYLKEDPITTFSQNGFNDLFTSLGKSNNYSYIFNGQLGQLDHALANATLTKQVVDIVAWPINADEPRVLDYSMAHQTPVHHTKYYAPDVYRSSDHDPIVIEMSLSTLFGDLDQDGDIDNLDLNLFLTLISSGELTDLAYDFNGDKQLSRRDIRGYMKLCTRTRCATE